jgi:hypothetical protein
MNSLSRFELGKQVPADFGVLNSLEFAARDRGLSEESRLFDEARMKVRWNAYRRPNLPEATAPVYSPAEWRLMQSVRIAIRLYPESVRAIEKAAGPALALVDEVLRSAEAAVALGPAFYIDLEQRLTLLADQRALEAVRERKP